MVCFTCLVMFGYVLNYVFWVALVGCVVLMTGGLWCRALGCCDTASLFAVRLNLFVCYVCCYFVGLCLVFVCCWFTCFVCVLITC